MMLFWDSFGHYDSLVFLAQKWDVVAQPSVTSAGSTIGTITQGTTLGRFGAGGVVFATTLSGTTFSDSFLQTTGCYIQKNYNAVSEIFVGMAVQQTGTQLNSGGRLIAFLDATSTQVGIFILPTGQLMAYRSTTAGDGQYLLSPSLTPVGSTANYTVLGTSLSAISSSAFDFLEIHIVHDPTNGSIEIRRNGAAFWTLSGVNTAISGSNQSASLVVGGYAARYGPGGNLEAHYLKAKISDFELYNTVANGSDALDPVTFTGDRHWETMTPTADGFYAQFSTTGSTDHFANIDEVPPNTTDYNSSNTVGNKDSFVVSAASGPSTASVFLGLTMYCQKTSGGSNQIKGLFRLSAADRNGTSFEVPSPWAFRQSFLASKPGGGAITVADLQPATGQPGYEKGV